MNVRFRLARLVDLNVLVAMMAEYQQDDPWSVSFEQNCARNAARGLIANPALGCIWLICDAENPIGYIVMTFDYSLEYAGKCAWVDEFFVSKAHRGRGIGSQALEFFAAEAKNLGARTIHLGVNDGNPAIELYRRAGFEDRDAHVMTKWVE